jgi:hypothetical protein
MYVDLLTSQDSQYGHRFYQRALEGVMKIFLLFLDHPENLPKDQQMKAIDVDDAPSSSAADAPSSSSPDKKASAPSSSSAAATANYSSVSNTSAAEKVADDAKEDDDKPENEDEAKQKDDDPFGYKLLGKDFLQEANLWCNHLEGKYQLCTANALCCYAEIKLRKQESSKAMDALKEGLARQPVAAELIIKVVELSQRYADQLPLSELIDPNYGSIENFVELTTAETSKSFDLAVARLRAYALIAPDKVKIDILLAPLKQGLACGVKIQSLSAALEVSNSSSSSSSS